MSIKDNGGPAFPMIRDMRHNPDWDHEEGMSLRDYFAAKAMQGLLANAGGPIQANGISGWGFCNCTTQNVVDMSYGLADAMLAERG